MKNIYTETTNCVAKHHYKKLTGKLLRHCERESKSTEARAKDNFEKKLEWFKESWMVKEPNQKPQNLPHEGNDEYKIKERRNHCKQKPKKKNKKKTKTKRKHQAIS